MGVDVGIAGRCHGDGEFQLCDIAGTGDVRRRFITFGHPPLARWRLFFGVFVYVMVESHVDSPGNASTDQKWIWLYVQCDRSS